MQIVRIPEEDSTRQINSLGVWFNEQEKYFADGRRCEDHRRTGQMSCALSQSMPETTTNRRHVDR